MKTRVSIVRVLFVLIAAMLGYAASYAPAFSLVIRTGWYSVADVPYRPLPKWFKHGYLRLWSKVDNRVLTPDSWEGFKKLTQDLK